MRNEEYPVNREWKQKAFSMPKLPGGDDGLKNIVYDFTNGKGGTIAKYGS